MRQSTYDKWIEKLKNSKHIKTLYADRFLTKFSAIGCLVSLDKNVKFDDNYGVWELLNPDTKKWMALDDVAIRYGIPEELIYQIESENDLTNKYPFELISSMPINNDGIEL